MSDRYTNDPPTLHPRVRGRCPSCGAESLFLGSQGYVTCSVIGCKDPGAPSDLLAGPDGRRAPDWASMTNVLPFLASRLRALAEDFASMRDRPSAEIALAAENRLRGLADEIEAEPAGWDVRGYQPREATK